MGQIYQASAIVFVCATSVQGRSLETSLSLAEKKACVTGTMCDMYYATMSLCPMSGGTMWNITKEYFGGLIIVIVSSG